MASLKQLKKAFTPLVELGKIAKVVEIGGVSITLRTLTAKEDADVQKAISEARNEEGDITPLDFVDLFRRESLARAIIRIGDFDLSGDSFETDELLENGTPIKVPKIEAVAEILDTMTRNTLSQLFDALGGVISEADQISSDKVGLDLEAEKLRLQNRLDEISRLETMQSLNSSPASAQSVVANSGQ